MPASLGAKDVYRLFVPSLLASLGACVVVAAQEPQRPTFRTGIDLLTLDVAIVDTRGVPVSNLQAGDFTVTVGGKPRKVVSARPYEAGRANAGAGSSVAEMTARHFSTAGAGRLITFVIDRESIQSGAGRPMLSAGATVIDALEPTDAASLVQLPGIRVSPTREHDRVRAALAETTGAMPRESWQWHIEWDEALGIERGDKQLLAQVLYRECRAPRPMDPAAPEGCDKGIVAQSIEMLLNARSRVQDTLANLAKVVDDLAQLRGPRHLIFISGGLLFDQSLLTDYNIFARRAESAGIVVHAIHVDAEPFDSATSRRVITSSFGSRELAQGLTTMAGMTGGSFYAATGSGAGVFERIASAITTMYQLGIEISAADVEGKPSEIKISVNRAGVSVRGPSHAVLPREESRAGSAAALLEQPTDIGTLPIRVTAYTTRGDEPSVLRVVVAAEITAGRTASSVDWAFSVLNAGNTVATGGRKAEAPAADDWVVTATTKLVPGRYRLRFAALASDGRAGVIDVPCTVGLRAADPLQLSDLVIGTAEQGRLVPRSRIANGSDVRMLIESMSADEARVEKSRIVLEVIPAGSAEAVKRLLMSVRTSESSTILLNEGIIEAGSLPPGRYVASAIATIDNEPVGRVTRLFEVTSTGQ